MTSRVTALFVLFTVACSGGDGLDPEIEAPWCETYEDYDIDGTDDAVYLSTYAAEVYLMLVEGDYGLDGTVDDREVYDRQSDGTLLRYEYDADADLTPNYIETFSYDGANRLEVYTEDDEADGQIELRQQNRWDGDLLMSSDYFHDGATAVDMQATYDYAGGLPERISWDVNMDGRPDYVDSLRYDGDKIALSERTDVASGDIIYRERRTHDSGFLIAMERDNDGDGAIEFSMTRSYDRFGRIKVTDMVDIDESGGETTTRFTRLYNCD